MAIGVRIVGGGGGGGGGGSKQSLFDKIDRKCFASLLSVITQDRSPASLMFSCDSSKLGRPFLIDLPAL